MDDFFTKERCDRCGKKLKVRTQSWFTEECICSECSDVEKDIKQRAINGGHGDMEGCGYVPEFKKVD